MKNILTIGFQIPGYSAHNHDITSNISMLDGDVIVFCPETQNAYSLFSLNAYETDGFFNGKPKLTETSSRNIENDFNHWRSEIIAALKADKTVFVFLSEKTEFSIFTHKEFSGTGRSRTPTNYYSSYDNYRWIPLNSCSVTSVKGKKIRKPKRSEFITFFDSYKSELSYDVVVDSDEIEPTFLTLTGDRTVGGLVKSKKGNLIFLPYPKYSYDEFTEENEKKESVWSEEGLTWGNKLVSHLLAIDKALSLSAEKTPPPEWVSDNTFKLESEKTFSSKVKSIEDKISSLSEELTKAQEGLSAEQEFKNLLFETGKPLEYAVIKALQVMGYHAEGYDDGTLELDQVIVSTEGDRYIGECEGKENKAINISKFRQLADAIHEDFERDEVTTEAIGILFGNPHRLLKPDERKEFFTKKCLEGAKRRSYALVKTPDFFTATQYLLRKNNESYKKKCRTAIKKGLGGIVEFPDVPKK